MANCKLLLQWQFCIKSTIYKLLYRRQVSLSVHCTCTSCIVHVQIVHVFVQTSRITIIKLHVFWQFTLWKEQFNKFVAGTIFSILILLYNDNLWTVALHSVQTVCVHCTSWAATAGSYVRFVQIRNIYYRIIVNCVKMPVLCN